ncbi:MAG TPA: cyclic nucleotide-binding domain-containing protein [Gaiellaceae bacterium]|jgi:CRP-like cAMP-binding protein|nr:cyclic nucleotide-binding domain-containing protein [Gaiellaceae bacterium]
MEGRSSLLDTLGRLALFADLTPPQLEAVAQSVDEQVFAEGKRVLRQGLSGSGFYVILDGQAAIQIGGEEPWTLGPGDFFGEVSALSGEAPTADVVAKTMLRCVVVPAPDLEEFLLERPRLLLRLLHAEVRRLRAALEWRA